MAEEGNGTVALFAASFDPVTKGHLDLIYRTLNIFDEIVVAVATNVDKRAGTFSPEANNCMDCGSERLKTAKEPIQIP